MKHALLILSFLFVFTPGCGEMLDDDIVLTQESTTRSFDIRRTQQRSKSSCLDYYMPEVGAYDYWGCLRDANNELRLAEYRYSRALINSSWDHNVPDLGVTIKEVRNAKRKKSIAEHGLRYGNRR